MDGINYYGIEALTSTTGSSTRSSTSRARLRQRGLASTRASRSPTSRTASATTRSSSPPTPISTPIFMASTAFQFLTGTLDDVRGALNLDLGRAGTACSSATRPPPSAIRAVPTRRVGIPDGAPALERHRRGRNLDHRPRRRQASRTRSPRRAEQPVRRRRLLERLGRRHDHDRRHARPAPASARPRSLNTGLGNDNVTVALRRRLRTVLHAPHLRRLHNRRPARDRRPGTGRRHRRRVRPRRSARDLRRLRQRHITGGTEQRPDLRRLRPRPVHRPGQRRDRRDAGFGGRGDVISSLIVDPRWAHLAAPHPRRRRHRSRATRARTSWSAAPGAAAAAGSSTTTSTATPGTT